MLGALTYTLSMASLVRERDSNFRGNVPPPPPYLVGLDSRLERGKQRQINHTEAKKAGLLQPSQDWLFSAGLLQPSQDWLSSAGLLQPSQDWLFSAGLLQPSQDWLFSAGLLQPSQDWLFSAGKQAVYCSPAYPAAHDPVRELEPMWLTCGPALLRSLLQYSTSKD